jgi:hypothetical protein
MREHKPKEGSRWTAYDGNIFRVLNTTEIDEHIWVHYILEGKFPREYSCYLESFLSRFSEIPK